MQITLHRPDLVRFIDKQVESGEYPTRDAVVEEALVRLLEDQSDGDWTEKDLREALRIGLEQLDQGKGVELKSNEQLDIFFEEIKRSGRAQLQQNPTEK